MTPSLRRLPSLLASSVRAGFARCIEARVRLPEDESELSVFGPGHVLPTYVQAFFGEEAPRARVSLRPRFGPWDRAIAEARASCALTVIHGRTPPAPLLGEALRVPRFVRLKVPLPPDVGTYLDALPGDAKRAVARGQAAGFERRICTDPGWLREFHERYQDPSVSDRHGKAGIKLSYHRMKSDMLRYDGEFVQVMKDGRCIAAALALRRGDTYQARTSGWLDGDEAWRRLRVTCALYWFRIQRAYERGCTCLDLGGSPPFLTNGAVAYKSKWGARLVPDAALYPMDYLLLNPLRPGWRRFIESHPMIAYGPNDTFEAHSLLPPEAYGLRPGILEGIQRWHPIVPPPGAR